MDILAKEIFSAIKEISKDTEGLTRPAYGPIETRTIKYLKNVANRFNIAASWDPAANIVFELPRDVPADRYIIVGSHVDSVPKGGNYDGLAGVVAGLLLLYEIQRSGKLPLIPVKVIGFRGEESPWFGHCHLGSKALLGRISGTELEATHCLTEKTLKDHLQMVGADTENISQGTPFIDVDKVAAYIELHIEQGPTLVQKDLPVAAVSGIRGIYRHRSIQCHGESGHSGAVPQQQRCDALFAAANLVNNMEDHCTDFLQSGGDLVMTSGIFSTDWQKHAITRIPDYVSFSFETRSISESMLKKVESILYAECAEIEKKRQVRFEIDLVSNTNPAAMDQHLTDRIAAAIASEGIQPVVIPSGAGHDASVFADSGIKTGMIFVRNYNGSHRPNEHLEMDDFLKGVAVLKNFIMEYEE
jgi:N-carbamoyl-L-amino-acid hydrolase